MSASTPRATRRKITSCGARDIGRDLWDGRRGGASLGPPWTAASAEGHAALEPPPSSAYTFLPGSGVRAHIAAREPFRARRSLPPSLTMNDVLPGARTAQPSAEDADPQETQEWVESLDAVVHHTGRDRARF